mgnify:CR=1 FL=1|jgi:hypothetical protein
MNRFMLGCGESELYSQGSSLIGGGGSFCRL